jgi:hypothetical protein
MALGAVRLAGVAGCRVVAAEDVLAVGHRLKMRRVAARRDATEVIKAWPWITNPKLIGKPMRLDAMLLAIPDPAISEPIVSTRPDPAAT